MELVTSAAVAIATIVGTKALEKAGQKVGEAVYDRTTSLLSSLKKESPETAKTIENAAQEPIDYGQAVLELEATAKQNPEVQKQIDGLVSSVKLEGLPNLEGILKEIATALESHPGISETYNIEKVINFAKGDIHIKEQNITL